MASGRITQLLKRLETLEREREAHQDALAGQFVAVLGSGDLAILRDEVSNPAREWWLAEQFIDKIVNEGMSPGEWRQQFYS